MNYKRIVEELESRTTSKEDITIKSVKKALNELDNPEKNLDVILVGGTNGKGSTAEIISELLQYQGKSVGCFKSPHLTSVRERIQLNSQIISQEDFLEIFQEVNNLSESLSFFEFTTVMAYLYFSKRDVDYAVMEVGMGGRLDATNAAEPELSVITNINLEHTRYLGESLEEISQEKAGITPENGCLVTGEDFKSIKKAAENRSSKIVRPLKLQELKSGKYRFSDQDFEIPLRGSFQKQNLENGLTAVRELESIPEDIEKSLSNLECAGRMEKISEEPEIILDGAHNPSALKQVVEDLPENFICVFNAIESKDSAKMIQTLEGKASYFIFTTFGVKWSANPSILNEKSSISSETVNDPLEAVWKALEHDQPVVAIGSLYLIGELKENQIEEKLKQKKSNNLKLRK